MQFATNNILIFFALKNKTKNKTKQKKKQQQQQQQKKKKKKKKKTTTKKQTITKTRLFKYIENFTTKKLKIFR